MTAVQPTEPPPLPDESPKTIWRIWHYLAALLGAIVTANVVFAFLAVDTASGVIDVDAVTADQLFALVIPAQHLGTLAVVALVLVAKRATLSDSLGFELEIRQFGWIAAGAALAIAAGLATVPLAGLLGIEDNTQGVVEQFGEVSTGGPLLIAVLTLVVLTPITEEILYRGVLQRAFGRWLGTVPMIAITSLIWGLVHLTDPAEGGGTWWGRAIVTFVPITIFGVVAAILTVRSDGRLGRAIFLHSGWNLLGVIALIAAQVDQPLGL